MGNRGDNKQSYALYEELKHLRVAPEAGTPYIYKRLDTQVHLPVEERAWQIRVPVPSTKGVRKSLKVTEKADAISKAEEMVLEMGDGERVRAVLTQTAVPEREPRLT